MRRGIGGTCPARLAGRHLAREGLLSSLLDPLLPAEYESASSIQLRSHGRPCGEERKATAGTGGQPPKFALPARDGKPLAGQLNSPPSAATSSASAVGKVGTGGGMSFPSAVNDLAQMGAAPTHLSAQTSLLSTPSQASSSTAFMGGMHFARNAQDLGSQAKTPDLSSEACSFTRMPVRAESSPTQARDLATKILHQDTHSLRGQSEASSCGTSFSLGNGKTKTLATSPTNTAQSGRSSNETQVSLVLAGALQNQQGLAAIAQQWLARLSGGPANSQISSLSPPSVQPVPKLMSAQSSTTGRVAGDKPADLDQGLDGPRSPSEALQIFERGSAVKGSPLPSQAVAAGAFQKHAGEERCLLPNCGADKLQPATRNPGRPVTSAEYCKGSGKGSDAQARSRSIQELELESR